MQCNGRRDCSITQNVFNEPCGSAFDVGVNFIDIKYICFQGKITLRTFYDSAFRVYFMMCSYRISSSKTCKYWLLSKHNFAEGNY